MRRTWRCCLPDGLLIAKMVMGVDVQKHKGTVAVLALYGFYILRRFTTVDALYTNQSISIISTSTLRV